MSRRKASSRRRGTIAGRTVVIRNQRGLHARAAAKMVEMANCFDAEITVSKGGLEVSGRSILGLMMLAAAPDSEIMLNARGSSAEEAVEALCRLVEEKFQED
ncbi:MAG: HPr family phosphocarrier protein [Rhodospirillales bacterium]|jgi:phosphocarrier protein|nr:HPr family phosphocarrier protein [Rhodospirillales bacterium]MDP6773158.1 HPr family phosphocarrier protein [Rhodospirillales bacterium]|tara:strand:+ start:236 stop:541 length:306 start_codon:yes stop_codon:yes gene_type:complete